MAHSPHTREAHMPIGGESMQHTVVSSWVTLCFTFQTSDFNNEPDLYYYLFCAAIQVMDLK